MIAAISYLVMYVVALPQATTKLLWFTMAIENDAYVFGQMLILAGLLKLARPKLLAPAAGSPAT